MAAASVGAVLARGRGMVHGLVLAEAGAAGRVAQAAFDRGMLVELAGTRGQVVKLQPPLTATSDEIDLGLAILSESVAAALSG